MTMPRAIRGLAAALAVSLVTFGFTVPAQAADTRHILVYRGNDAYFDSRWPSDYSYTKFGVAAGRVIDTVTTLPADLSAFACIVLPMNGTPFDAEQKVAFSAYVQGGGRLVAIGEQPGFLGQRTTMNDLAGTLGSGLSLLNQGSPSGYAVTTNVDPNPFTAGVSNIKYALFGAVGVPTIPGAVSLVRGVNGVTFIAAQLLGAGVFVLAGDSNVWSDGDDLYTGTGNGTLAANLCGQSMVTAFAAATSLSSDPNPSDFGETVTLTATVAPAPGLPAGGTPTGTVKFRAGAAVLGETALDATGVATLTTTALTEQTHSLTAEYVATGAFLPNTSAPLAHVVAPRPASSTTLVSATANTFRPGDDQTFVATVTPTTATGQVRFSVDGAQPGVLVDIAAGQASFAVTLAAGNHTIDAGYLGDAQLQGSTAIQLPVMIGEGGGGVALGATRTDGSYTCCGARQTRVQVSTAAGQPSYTIPEGMNQVVAWSTRASSVSYKETGGVALEIWRPTGVPNQFTLVARSPVEQMVLGQVNTFTLSTPIAVEPGDVLGLNVENHESSTGAPGAENVVGWKAVAAVGATVNFNVYSGSILNVSAVVAHGDPSVATTTALASGLNPSLVGQPVTLTATVARAAGAPEGPAPAGTVTFREGATVLAEVPLDGAGAATFTTSTLAAGTHTLTAEYAPAGLFLASSSASLDQVVRAASALMLAPAAANSSLSGEPQTFVATVSPATATGQVRFTVDGAAPGVSVGLAAGQASLTVVLAGGAHTVGAEYLGDGLNAGSTAEPLAVTIGVATTTALVTNPPASVYGQPVDLVATVSRPDGAAGAPEGTVVFKHGTTPLGDPVAVTVSPSDSSVGMATMTLAAGTLLPPSSPYTLAAEFVPASGTVFRSSTGSVQHVVTKASYALRLTPEGPLTLTYPAVQQYTVTVEPVAPSILIPNLDGASFFDVAAGSLLPVDPVVFTAGTASASVGLPANAPGERHELAVVARASADRAKFVSTAVMSNIVSVTVEKAPVSVVADAASMTYGGPVPAFAATVAGLVAPDTFESLGGACSASVGGVPVTESLPAGVYAGAITCTGLDDDANYAVTSTAGTLTVLPKVLTVTAEAKTAQYSDPLPALTVAYDGFVLGEGPEALTGTLSCGTDADVNGAGQVLSPAGAYAITCSGLEGANYAVTFLPGTLTVTPEDTVVRLAQSNPHAVSIVKIGKRAVSPEMTFTARVAGVADGSYGDITGAEPVTVTLTPVANGSPIEVSCDVDRSQPATATDPGFELVSCTVAIGAVPINVYQVSLSVGGGYYRGGDSSVLTVYDPNAGGSTGGGIVATAGGEADLAYSAKYLKNGRQVQGKFLYIARDEAGEVVHILKGNVMSTMAINGQTVSITGKATLDGLGNYSYILTGIDHDAGPAPNPSAPDEYGQLVTDAGGAPAGGLTIHPAAQLIEGDIFVGK